jgi:hypothetical protein
MGLLFSATAGWLPNRKLTKMLSQHQTQLIEALFCNMVRAIAEKDRT